ncbi:MAG: hypothetical protein RBQ87_03965 [Candidatus Cloacimonadaceae bacterium]|nr:hypothetical protein [Candidatus Cloacimonadota bacterium]MDY0325314.1 hypothetical protein [Candidatus Cloacimonadaceae bacterium]
MVKLFLFSQACLTIMAKENEDIDYIIIDPFAMYRAFVNVNYLPDLAPLIDGNKRTRGDHHEDYPEQKRL